jgi:WD40 repeat protein
MLRRLLFVPSAPLVLLLRLLSLLTILVVSVPTASAQAPDRTPVPRIEAGAHVGLVEAAAADAAGRVLVTASYDKTARVWSLPDLRPLGVLRPQVGAEREGGLYAVAVSPDGRLAAVGGWLKTNDAHDVLLFDLQTRQVVRRLGGLPNVVTSLAFSSDGAQLAAGLGADGIRLWRVADGVLLAEDRNYSDYVYGLAFASDGRLAAASFDGAVRLYDAAGRQLRREATTAARRPFQIRFSPDGQLLALGFADAVALEVRDGTTLALLRRPIVAGLSGGGLARVGWSADSVTLFAGGHPWVDGGRPVFAWARAGAGGYRVVATGFADDVASILPLADGRLAFVSLSGDIAVVGRDGAHHRTGAGDLRVPMGDFSASSRRLHLSRDGAVAEWAFFDAPSRWLRFDAAGPTLAAGEPSRSGLTAWSDTAPGLRVTDWHNRTDPKLNGRPLALETYERARSVAAAPGRALLGASWSLRLFDAEARQIWKRPVPGVAWRVNLSPDGRLAVAALADGTIRWYRARDGAELLALFVTPDAQRWVAFTPTGYYAASAGGEELIGWHVNNGPDRAADFFGAARFRDTYHRPDIVTRLLSTLDEGQALAQADAARGQRPPTPVAPAAPAALRTVLPPVATILSPAEGAAVPAGGEARLMVRLRSPSGQPIARVRVLVDSRPSPGAVVGPPRPLPPPGPGEAAEEREVRLNLAASAGREAIVQIIAATEEREGEPATVRLRVAAPPAAAAPARPLPRLNAVLVGVSAYRQERLRLDFAAKDARDLEAVLRRQRDILYREVNVRVLPDMQASREALLEALVWLDRETTQFDTAVLFLAGHGVTTEDGEFFFLPAEADEDRPEVTGVSGANLVRRLRRMTGRVLVFLDTCYAGALYTQRTRGPPNMAEVINELLAAQTGVAIYSATTERTRAEERRELRNGVFTAALLRGLAGAADQPPADGVIRIQELAYYLAEEVKRLTNGKQKPTFMAPEAVPNLPVFAPAR